MSERTFTIKLTEDELISLISYHAMNIHAMANSETLPSPDYSIRLHDLVKRLHKNGPEIEGDPRPAETTAKPQDWQQQPKQQW